MNTIHTADPALRRLTVYVIVIIVAAGVAGLVIFQRWFSGVQLLPPEQAWPELVRALTWIGGAMLLMVLATSMYALRLGAQIKRVNQYPLPGAKTIRDTTILEGKYARSRGNLIQAVGAMLLVLALLLLFLCIRLASMFDAGVV
ncbi:MAG: hypothetical protein V4628_00925 [Pseudomonadota bacterium]